VEEEGDKLLLLAVLHSFTNKSLMYWTAFAFLFILELETIRHVFLVRYISVSLSLRSTSSS